jgi:hypothetical protein
MISLTVIFKKLSGHIRIQRARKIIMDLGKDRQKKLSIEVSTNYNFRRRMFKFHLNFQVRILLVSSYHSYLSFLFPNAKDDEEKAKKCNQKD